MTISWADNITSSDFTTYIEFISLLEYADAWLNADRRPFTPAEPIRAISRARKLLIHSNPKSQLIKRLMRDEWLYSRNTRTALTSKHPYISANSISLSEIKKQILSRPRLGLLLDLDSRLGRSGLLMLEVTQIIADSDACNKRQRNQAKRSLRKAESSLNLDFDQIVERVSAISEKLIMSDHRRWDYAQSRINYWDHAFALQRKLLKLLSAYLTQTDNSASRELLMTLHNNIIATACDIRNFELNSARENLLFHFAILVA